MVAGHLQEKKGFFYIVLNFVDSDGKRKRKWIATGLPVKGNKRKAEAMLVAERQKYQPAEYQRTADANMLFADYMLYWLRQIKSSVDITTYAGYKTNVEKRIVPFFRGRKVTLGGLRACDIQDFYTYVQRNWRSAITQSSSTTQTSAKPSTMPFGWRRFQ